MRVNRSDRLLIVGRTGTGKSVLARALFAGVAPPRCVIDPKDDVAATGGAYADRRVAVSFTDPSTLPDADSIRFVPRDPADIDAYDRLYSNLFDRRGVFVWADEVGVILPAKSATPPAARRLISQGRRWGIGHMALHQRPIEIAPIIGANAEHIIVFATGNPVDVATLAGYMSIAPADLDSELRMLPKYGFCWYAVREQTLNLCPPIARRRK